MGLSLRNIGKKIEDVLGAGVHDVQHVFGGGQPAAPPTPAPVRAAPIIGAAPAAPGIQKPNPLSLFAPQPVINNTPALPKRSAIPTPSTLHPAANTGQLMTNNSPTQLGQVQVKNPNASVNKPNLPYKTPGFVTNVVRPLLRTVPEAVTSLDPTQQTYHPGTGLQQALFGATPVQNIEKKTVNTYQQHPGGGALPLSIGEAVGSIIQDAPLVGGAVKGAKVALKSAPGVLTAAKPVLAKAGEALSKVDVRPSEVPISDGRPVVTAKPAAPVKVATPVEAPTEKAAAFVKSQSVPQGAVATGKVVTPKTSIPEVNAAIKDVSTQYAKPVTFSGKIQDIVAQAQGQSTIGTRAANGLRKALSDSDNLTKEENQQVSDILDKHPGAIETATPKAQEVANALKPLQDQGFQIRKAINPNVNKVQDYVTRLPSKTVGAAVDAGTKVLGKIRSLSDITNLNSVFSQSRKIGKFVGPDGTPVYGDPVKLGLTQHNDGTVTDAAGNAFKPVAVSKRELEANGAGKYEHNISRISGIYHSDTASLKVRAEALQHIKSDPKALGLSTVQEADTVPVTRISELSGYFGKPKDVKALEDNFGFKNASGPIGKAYDAVSNVATQFIVLNPFFHGMNQLYQTGIAAGNMPGMTTGWATVAKHVFDVTEEDVRGYLGAGGHIPTYGLNMENTLSRMTHGVTKLNNKAMSGIETKLRVGLYKASLEKGMTPKAAVSNIDKFLGDSHQIGVATRRFTLFFHYFKTMAGAIGSQVAHPAENMGANINTVVLAAITAAVTEGYQHLTGNKAAYVRVPGELGLVKEAVESAAGIAKGDSRKAVSIATNRVNPVLKEGAQQVFNQDLFTGKKVTDTGRLTHAVQGTVAPAQVAMRTASGKKSPAETASNQLGLYTPHAKGYQASSKIPALNTKGAIPGNGVAEQNAYFNGLAKAQKAVSGDTKATAGLAYYLAKSHDPNTGQSIQNSPSESIQNSAMLTNNDKLRGAVQKFEQNQPSHDPLWDLSPDKLKVMMQYKEQFTGDAAKKFILSQNSWITDAQNKSAAYYNNLQVPGGGKGSRPNDQTPTYPTFDPTTTKLMSTYDAADPTQRTALIKQYGGELSTAWNQVAQWTNAMRKAEGAPELKDYPVADAETQKILDYYNALPKGNGPKGGSPNRAAWIQANPGAYKKMQDYLTQASMDSLVKNASLDQFKGSEPDQTLLKDIQNVGSHDIYKDPSGQYSVNPSAAYAAQSSLNSSYSSNYNSAAHKDARYLANAAKHTVGVKSGRGKIRRPSVKVKATKAQFAVKSRGLPRASKKVALKPSKV